MTFGLKRLCAVIVAGLVAASATEAAELILFDDPGCSGEFRMLDRSVSDLRHVGFDNRAASLMVLSGEFRLYRDAGYRQHNGPAISTAALGSSVTCWSLPHVSDGAFPVDRMSAVELVQDTDGPRPDGVAIVYDGPRFSGAYRILTREVPDFRYLGFDNRVESIAVLSGEWTFFRNADFGAPHDRPSITLGPGHYADIARLPGYHWNHFPADLMSAAKVAPPEPAPLICEPGLVAGETACHTCTGADRAAAGSALPDRSGRAQCACAPGFDALPGGAVTHDGVLFRACARITAAGQSGNRGPQSRPLDVSLRF